MSGTVLMDFTFSLYYSNRADKNHMFSIGIFHYYGIIQNIPFPKAKRRNQIMMLLKRQREERIKVRFYCSDTV